MVAQAFHGAYIDTSRSLGTGSLRLDESANQCFAGFAWVRRAVPVIGLEPASRSSLVEGALGANPGHRGRLGSDPPVQAVASSDVFNASFSPGSRSSISKWGGNRVADLVATRYTTLAPEKVMGKK